MMNSLYVLESFLLILLSTGPLPNRAQEGSTCTLPNNAGQSTCIRWHYCESFLEIVKKAGGNPSAADRARISSHTCGKTQLVCCPDNVITTTSTTTTTSTVAPIKVNSALLALPALSDLNALKSHRNYYLINDKCGSSSIDRIVGGHEAEPGEFPWMALLQFKARLTDSLSFSCGGALITPRYVLTAAHCVTRDLVAVRLGEHRISTYVDCKEPGDCIDPVQDIPIDGVARHKQYDSRLKINDIALLRLKRAADTSKGNVKTICLPTSPGNQIGAIEAAARDNMFITGWGKAENGKQSDVLLKGNVPFVNHAKCVQRFAADNLPIYETYLCAGGKNKTDTCNGDSGGPIQTVGSVNGKQRMILYGVVSVGVACLNPDLIYPGIYTNVAYYLNWILDNMEP